MSLSSTHRKLDGATKANDDNALLSTRASSALLVDPSRAGPSTKPARSTGRSSGRAGRLFSVHGTGPIVQFSGWSGDGWYFAKSTAIKSRTSGSPPPGSPKCREYNSPCFVSGAIGRTQPLPSTRSPATHRPPSLVELARQIKSTRGISKDERFPDLPTSR